MRFRHVFAAAVLVAATFVVTRAVYSQEGEGKDAGAGMPSEEEMKAMIEMATPNEEHAKLAAMVGTWDTVMTCEGMPAPCVGTVTTESLLGGRVFLSRFQGDMGGMPMEGMELKGYDKEKKEHWSVWCDSMMTGNMVSHGQRDGDTISYDFDAIDWAGAKFDMSVVLKAVDADHLTADMTMQVEGKPDQKSTIKYTRRGAPPAAK